MAVPPSPIAVASAATRNLVPLVGIVFLGWSGANVLLLYFLDTLLAMAVMFAGLARHFMPPAASESLAARVNAEAGCIAVALFLAAFIAVPLGMPLFILFMASGVTWHSVTDDPMFRSGLVLQAIAAFWSCLGLYRALRTHTPEELRLKRQFALVFLRWIAVLMVWYLGVGFLFGRWAPVVFVAVYAAATIMIEVAPDQFLRAMPGGTEDADPPARGTAQAPPAPSAPGRAKLAARWRRKHGK
jgi:hypothetical protein